MLSLADIPHPLHPASEIFFYSFNYDSFKALLLSLFSSSTLSKTEKLRLVSFFLSITIRLTFMDFFLNFQTFLLENVQHCPGGFVRCMRGAMQGSASGRNSREENGVETRSFAFIYALVKQNRQLRWLASTGQLLYKIR